MSTETSVYRHLVHLRRREDSVLHEETGSITRVMESTKRVSQFEDDTAGSRLCCLVLKYIEGIWKAPSAKSGRIILDPLR